MIEQQKNIAKMMELYEQSVRPLPAMLTDPKERLLTANLVIEEALEFVNALGFDLTLGDHGFKLVDFCRRSDLIETADAIGDVLVVILGAANRLGINAEDVFNEVNRSNMSKTWSHCMSCDAELDANDRHLVGDPLVCQKICPALLGGKGSVYGVEQRLHKRAEDGKVIKSPTYSPADIVSTLAKQSPLPFATVASNLPHEHRFSCSTDEQQCDGECKANHQCTVCRQSRAQIEATA
jgi:NTP pyrophosphatase (non-canonical NTP hydrolase)